MIICDNCGNTTEQSRPLPEKWTYVEPWEVLKTYNVSIPKRIALCPKCAQRSLYTAMREPKERENRW